MFKAIRNLSVISIMALLLAACGPSEKDQAKAKELGFENYKEMKELNARGYMDKSSYLEAISRTPTYCFEGGADEYKKRCEGKRVIWIIHVSSIESNGVARAYLYDLDSYGLRNTVKTIDIFSNGKEKPSGSFVVEGKAGNYNTFYPDLNSASYVSKLEGDGLDRALAESRKLAQIKTQEAKSLGFNSLAEMNELKAQGYKNKEDYLEAKKKQKDDADQKAREANEKEYLDSKKKIDWLANKIGGYKGAAVCKVTLDLIETSMINKGMLGNKDNYEAARRQYELVDVKYLMDGVSQSDLDAAYSSALKQYGAGKNPVTVDCYGILDRAPK